MNERENYLDNLLNKLNGTGKDQGTQPDTEDEFLKSYDSSLPKIDEDDFLKEFEKSMVQPELDLNMGMDIDLALDSFEEEGMDFGFEEEIKKPTVQEKQIKKQAKVPHNFLDDVDSIVNSVKNEILSDDKIEKYNDIPIDDTAIGNEIDELADSIPSYHDEFMVNTLDRELEDAASASKDKEADLFQLLADTSQDEEKAEVDDLFQQDEMPMDELQSMAMDLANEIESLNLSDEKENKDKDSASSSSKADEKTSLKDKKLSRKEKKLSKKEKKAKESKKNSTEELQDSIWKRLGRLFFGEVEEKELIPSQQNGIEEIQDIEHISDENLEILRELESNRPPTEEEKEQKKKQDKAEAKAQKKKEKEEKKAEKKAKAAQKKKEKQDKPKKEKKPAEPVEKLKPLPKGPVVLILLVGISLVILVNLLSGITGYNTSISQAKEYYAQGNYVDSYGCLSEKTVRKADRPFYEKVKLSARVQQQINLFEAYQQQQMQEEALSALICGIGRYDNNFQAASEAGAAPEFETMIVKIQEALTSNYNMSPEQARALYAIRDKEEYTYAVYEAIAGLG
ncbi:MAG: hypothetical protein RSD28_05700 [Lachnospiraceae bacterium]